MPYIHRGCGGVVPISFIRVRCKKCKKRWPRSVLWALSPPKDMKFTFDIQTDRKITYSKPAQRIINALPWAKFFADRMPNLPRWGRILVTLGVVTAILFVIQAIRG